MHIRHYLYIIFSLLVFSIILIGAYDVNLYAFNQAQIKQTQNIIFESRNDNNKDTVNTIFEDINVQKTMNDTFFHNFLDRVTRMTSLLVNYGIEIDDAVRNVSNIYYNTDFFVWDGEKITFSSKIIDTKINNTEDLRAYILNYDISLTINMGKGLLIVAVPQDFLDVQVETKVRETLHAMNLVNDGHVEIKKINNYSGGVGYATSIINPIEKEQEGQLLSTLNTDASGNTPLAIELENLLEYGEASYTYDYKKEGSDNINTRLAYSRMYKEYGWVVSVSVSLDDVNNFAKNEANKFYIKHDGILINLVFFSLIICCIILIVVYIIENVYFRDANAGKNEKEKIDDNLVTIDPLTKISTRYSMELDFENIFSNYLKNTKTVGIIIGDLDDFKRINDTYGYKIGDAILIALIEIFKGAIRTSDFICRWGGEEFLLVLPGASLVRSREIAEDLRIKISETVFEYGEDKINITISFGVSEFLATDTSYRDAVTRSDIALHKSKNEGKNRVSIARVFLQK